VSLGEPPKTAIYGLECANWWLILSGKFSIIYTIVNIYTISCSMSQNFLFSSMACSQIWLSPLVDDSQPTNLTDFEKKTHTHTHTHTHTKKSKKTTGSNKLPKYSWIFYFKKPTFLSDL